MKCKYQYHVTIIQRDFNLPVRKCDNEAVKGIYCYRHFYALKTKEKRVQSLEGK